MRLFKRLIKRLRALLAMLTNAENMMYAEGILSMRHFVPNGDGGYAEVVGDRRRVKKCVTDAFVQDLVDELQSSQADFSTYKYHHSGTGTNAEDATDTALQTPVESSREVGTQVEGATANIYKSVATITYTDTRAITEHGLFNGAGTGDPPTGADMMDRSVFSAVNVSSGEKIEFTYELTVNSGG